MFSHIFLGASNFDRAFAFYTALVEVLGIKARFIERERPWAGWQSTPGPRPLLLIGTPFNGEPHVAGNGQMLAFLAGSRELVDKAYNVALANGGTSEGAPGLRPEYHENYYGAYLRDTEGNKLCVACHVSQAEIPAPGHALLRGTCHCGAVSIELPSAPEMATACNCSLCRRVGGLWAYYAFGTVRITGHPENTQEYIQGDKTLATVRCATCGCVTHWEPLPPEPGKRHGVNLRNFDPKLLESLRIRRFDGADTWEFLD